MNTDASDFILTSYKQILNVPVDQIMTIGSDTAFPIFSESTLSDLCKEAIQKLTSEPMVVELQSPIKVVGDLHGSIHDLLRILSNQDPFDDASFLFLGDYVDRGQFSLEVITLLLAFYCQNAKITLLRGNHEVSDICSVYGFKSEIESVYNNDSVFNSFVSVFNHLPLAAIIDDSIFCVHGGISQRLSEIQKIKQIPKPLTNVNDRLVHDLLWSHPSSTYHLFAESIRGKSFTFGVDATTRFLEQNGLKAILRAHQYCEDGLKSDFTGLCITVFSASSYKFDGSNKSAIVVVKGDNYGREVYEPLPRMQRNNAQFFTMHRKSRFPRSESITLMNSSGIAHSPSSGCLNRVGSTWNLMRTKKDGKEPNSNIANSRSYHQNIVQSIFTKDKTHHVLLGRYKRNTKLMPTFLEEEC
ncbi:Ser/Thr protein phosphatase [Tritrichomonas foetus]|uniref:Serine/threonine-protein phosphatase n=1 Tax=Tritrichomonas foetus TaxID=1144522 RepID=A0A1J4JKE8_9EUKA|nr:Ser/Thr protein phosphatase [Tritrichomonas foetus]|eukprot:OHS97716.1 Ser/Thr protein phosphatase [Tritrichomonas foetus]